MQKLAIDAVHRISLGLDALVPNHIHPIPYLNGRTQKYDLDLRIGYAGKDYYYRQMALEAPKDIRYELVYKTDSFSVRKKDEDNEVETYTFVAANPFNRGDVVGGFGYISYPDPLKNKIVIVTMDDFKKAQDAAGSDKFWGKWKENMQLKTIVHRTVTHIILDPKKINASFAKVEHDDLLSYEETDEMSVKNEIGHNANVEVIDIGTTAEDDQPDEMQSDEITDEEKAEIIAAEKEAAEKEAKAKKRGPGF
jgi:recombination protein RecT